MIIFQLIQKSQLRGAEVFAAQLSAHLERKGHKVYMLPLYPGDSKLPFSGTYCYLNRPVQNRWFDFQGWKRLHELIQEYEPDVIQCNAGDTLKFTVLSKILFGWKQPIVARNASMVSLYLKSPFVKWINHFLYRKTNHIVSVSHATLKDLVRLFPFAKNKASVIPVGIEGININPVEWKGGHTAKKHIVHVGGFSFEKNHKGLLSIFKQLTEETQENVHLHLFGEGPLQAAVKEEAASLGLAEKITFYGWVSNPTDYIAKADVLVLPSIIEGLPGVLLEAMYSKIPVIAYNVGGISEIVNEQTGYLVPKGDEAIFVEALKTVLDAVDTVKVQKAYDLVSQQYVNEALALQFVSVYKTIALSTNKQ
ncbi:glycosyltransferase [Flavobacterium enshiense]|uniref:glycosyltransferase n=1 Tax=Flavobacterium enshiense TaxID=1341165 RepID=UPI00345D48C9